MIKKVVSLILFLGCSSILIGCTKVQDLSDEETELIAQYAADMLLKYDLNYENRMEKGNQEASEQIEEESTEKVTTESTTKKSTTEESKTEVTTEEKKTDKENDEEEKETEKPIGNEKDIAKFVGIDNVSILYDSYAIMKEYPTRDKEGAVINITASEGYELLILKFKVANLTDEPVQVSMLDKKIKYDIICNQDKAAKPMLTILLDDLETLDIAVNPDREEEAVLIFQISNDIKNKLQSINLKIQYEDKENMINIL